MLPGPPLSLTLSPGSNSDSSGLRQFGDKLKTEAGAEAGAAGVEAGADSGSGSGAGAGADAGTACSPAGG